MLILADDAQQKDWFQKVAEGGVSGYSFDRKFGYNPSISSNTPADIWEYGQTSGAEVYTFSTTADIDSMSSSSAVDSEGITVVGLTLDGTEVIQTKALNGQVTVTLDTPLWRVNRAYNSNGTNLLGNVYIYTNGAATINGIPSVPTTVRAYISIGRGQTLQCIYTIPKGKTGYFCQLNPSIVKKTAGFAVFSGRVRASGKVFRTQDIFGLTSTGTSKTQDSFKMCLPFTEMSDFVPNADTDSTMGFSLSFIMLLKDN